MRNLLFLLIGIVIMVPGSACHVSQPASGTNEHSTSGLEVVIKLVDSENAIVKVMDVFSRNGLIIMKMQQTFLSSDRQEIRIDIKGGDRGQLNEAEYQLRNVINVESISIRRL